MTFKNSLIEAKNDFDWWELDNIAVKGKELPLRIYTVHKETSEHREWLEDYYAGRWDRCIANYRACQSAAPDMSQYYDKMIERLAQGKPVDWDGIYRATSK